jgi:hypothetical protein
VTSACLCRDRPAESHVSLRPGLSAVHTGGVSEPSAPVLRCTVCEAALLETDERPLSGEEIAAAAAVHYAVAHGGASVPTQRAGQPVPAQP